MQTLQSAPSHSPFAGRSLFYKVLALVLTTAVIAVCAIGLYLQFILRDTYKTFLREQAGSYMQLVLGEIGTPPDTAAARRIVNGFPLDVRLEDRAGAFWSSSQSLPSSRVLRANSRSPFNTDGDSILQNDDDHYYMVSHRGGWSYVIRLRSASVDKMVVPATLILVAVLGLLFIAAYYSVQRFLRPVRELMAGVKEVGSGNFEHQVPICSNDELGELTRAFNAMADQVAAIIASKRRLLFDVSHELRSPLTRMNVALAMLPEGKAAITIERNVRELNTMITELLENERLAVLGGTLVVENLDVVAMARTVVESFGHDEERIEIDSLIPRLDVTADSQRLTVALRNVISNALKYSRSNEGRVKVAVFPDDDGVRMVISDEGIGIPPEAQEKVFEPFYRTDSSRSRETGGYGLGLSLTRAIIEAHGGTIRLNSTPGCGTTVMIWIPKSPSPNAVARTIVKEENLGVRS